MDYRHRYKRTENAYLGVALLILVVIVSVSASDWQAYRRSSASVKMSREVIFALNDVVSSIKDAETSQRGFLLTGDQAYLSPFRKTHSTLADQLGQLCAMPSLDPTFSSDCAQLTTLTRDKMRELEQTINLANAQGVSAALTVVRKGQGKVLMDQIRGLTKRMSDRQFQQWAILRLDAEKHRYHTIWIDLCGAFIVFIFLLIATISINRARNRLEDVLQDLKKGQLHNRRQAEVLENMREGVSITDEKGSILYTNRALESMFGYAAGELVGQHSSIKSALGPEENARMQSELMAKLKTDGVWSGEWQNVKKDGTKFVTTLKITTVVFEGQRFIIRVHEDITERKRANEKLIESEARFRKLADTAPVLIWMAGVDKQYHYFNRGWLEFTGRMLKQELGNGWTEGLHQDDLRRATELYSTNFDERKPFQMEYRLRRRDGQFRWMLDTGMPIFTGNGTFEGYIGSCIDIHERKTMEQVLERRVQERTEELSQTNSSLLTEMDQRRRIEEELVQSRKLEAVGRLAGGVAHDFNNLMTGVLGLSEDLLSEPDIAEHHRRDVQEISRAAERAASLTKQLLAFGRRQIVLPVVLNLNIIVSEMKNMLQRLIGEDIQFFFIPDRDLGNVRVDPGQIEQILMNLVMNARDAMPQGGKITIETTNIEISQEHINKHFDITPGPHVMMAISDTGQGMDAETQAHVFEPFFTTKEKDKGTGLGLATVYGIVKQNGGHIYLYSNPGAGTTFKIYLPRIFETTSSERRSLKREELPRGTETVLIVEDEDLVRRVAVKALHQSGYRVLEARNGQEAIEVSAAFKAPIDLLLTDVIMPGLNGRQLAELLADSRPKMKVLYMSGYTENVIVNRGILKPGINFIEKTFTSEKLCLRVREILDASTPV